MCLSIPSEVLKIDPEKKTCLVDTMGTQREVSLDILEDEVEVGDYVLIHIGYVINKISKEYAMQSLELYEQIVQSMQEEEDARIG